jgi:hypothetical protein
MLEHQKIVLNGVKNDKKLFRKELIKSLAWLNSHEQIQLRKWVRENFHHVHAEIIKDVLYPKYEQAS